MPYFYPRSPCGERQAIRGMLDVDALFLSTLSLRRATQQTCYERDCPRISIHALLAESDPERWPGPRLADHFYPRSPCGERRADAVSIISRCKEFLSTLSLRRATGNAIINPSIRVYFYPRSPCGERQYTIPLPPVTKKFLSTLSLRRATRCFLSSINRFGFLSTLSLRRATK